MKFSGTFGDGFSGSLAGITASHNRFGEYLRARTTPVNPQSTRQNTVRANFASLVTAWANSLTQVERDAWITWADNTPMGGQQTIITGLNAFVRFNTVRLQIGEARVDAAPTAFNNGAPVTSTTVINDGTPNVLAVDNSSIGTALDLLIDGGASDDADIAIYIGPPISTGVKFFNGPFQLVDVQPIVGAAITVPWDEAIGDLENSNGVLAVGQFRSIKYRVVYDDGRLSDSFQYLSTVVADSV